MGLLVKDCFPGNLEGGPYIGGEGRFLVKFGEIVVCLLSILIVPNGRPPQQIVRSLKLCLGGSINGSVVVLEKDMVGSVLPAHVIRIRWQLLTPDEFEINNRLGTTG